MRKLISTDDTNSRELPAQPMSFFMGKVGEGRTVTLISYAFIREINILLQVKWSFYFSQGKPILNGKALFFVVTVVSCIKNSLNHLIRERFLVNLNGKTSTKHR